MFSTTAAYAVRAVLQLAHLPPDHLMQSQELAKAIDVPHNYLGKILNQLVRGRILKSHRGKRGGFQLAIPPDRLTLLDIAVLFDRVELPRCLLGRDECSEVDPCPLHDRWRAASQEMESLLSEATLADLLRLRPTGESPA
jgi:Rrf2 family iron-sulfur cluster assembly transcriptional regulator